MTSWRRPASRRRHAARGALLLLAVAAAVLCPGGGARAEDAWQDLDLRTRDELQQAMRTYLDPQLEFLWEPKRALQERFEALEARGLDPLADIGLLRSIVYAGRHFQPRFDDAAWRQRADVQDWQVTEERVRNLRNEEFHLSYSEPKDYPGAEELDRHRDAVHPLLLVLHEQADLVDGKGRAVRYPGAAALARLYPPGVFGDLRDQWFLLAPTAPGAAFLDANGRLQDRFATDVLREMWQRYHVDFDRFVVDGRREAAVMAAAHPFLFAGLVLRGGDLDAATVVNIATLPVFVAGAPDLARRLEAAGHPDVTSGDDAALAAWLEARRRVTPKRFSWRIANDPHLWANWVLVQGAAHGPETRLDVEVMDTAAHPNTIRLDARGVEEVTLFLNDEVIDLDREVRLLVNGELRELGRLERDLTEVFQNGITQVRGSMYFGWLHPVFRPGVRIAAPPAAAPEDVPVVGTPEDESKAGKFWDKAVAAETEGETKKARQLYQLVIDVGATSRQAAARAALDRLEAVGPDGPAPESPARSDDAGRRLEIQYAWLFGRPDLAETHLDFTAEAVAARLAGGDGGADGGGDPVMVWPILLRDLWWRPVDEAGRWKRMEILAWALQAIEARASPALRAPYRWLREGGEAPYPSPPIGEDPWPVLSTLVLDRQLRETQGAVGYLETSPLVSRPPPEAWADWWATWLEGYRTMTLARAYEGDDLTTWPEDERRVEEALDAEATRLARRNTRIAVAAVGLLLLLGLGLAWRLGRPRHPHNAT